MADGLGHLTVALVPPARPPVQFRHLFRLLVQQARAQHVGKEMVIAIPASAIVERDHEQVRSLQRLQHTVPRSRILTGDGIAQHAAQTVQYGGLQQELADLVGLAFQDLFHQVVDDVAIVAAEPGDERGGVFPPLY